MKNKKTIIIGVVAVLAIVAIAMYYDVFPASVVSSDEILVEDTPKGLLSVAGATCIDNDNGKDYYTSSYVVSASGNTYTDFCDGTSSSSGNQIVKEYFCKDNKVYSIRASRSGYLCFDGKLVVFTGPPAPDCSSPNGLDGDWYCSNNKGYVCDVGSWQFNSNCDYCNSGVGSYNSVCGKNIEEKCSDGTSLNQCSSTKPRECVDGDSSTNVKPVLTNSCGKCGCPSGDTCDGVTDTCVNNAPANSCIYEGVYYANGKTICASSGKGIFRCDYPSNVYVGNCVGDCTSLTVADNSVGLPWCCSESCSNGCYSDGSCIPDDNTGNVICVANAKKCSNSNTVSTCNSEGTKWIDSTCSQGKECSVGSCVSINTCLDLDCDDGNSCTTDSCSDGYCTNELVSCTEGEYCDSNTGNCVLPAITECTAVSDCADIVGNIVDCVEDKCVYAPTGSSCKTYQDTNEDGDCVFSLSNVFTKSGIKEYYNDFTWQIYVIGVLIVVIIGLLIAWKKSSTPKMF